MKMSRVRVGATVVAALFVCAGVTSVLGDVLYLKDGSKIVGRVQKTGDTVFVQSESGRHTIAASMIDHVEWGVPEARATKSIASAGETKATTTTEPARKKDIDAILNQRIELDFTDTPLPDVIMFFQSVKDVNFVLDRRNIPEDNAVTIKMKDVRLKTALKMILEPMGLDYEVRENLIYISTRAKIQRYEVRVVDVRDLLVNFEDRISSSSNMDLASQTTGQSGTSTSSGDDDDDDNSGKQEGLISRSRSLARLITETVRPESWEKDAARVVGGPKENESDTENNENYGFSY